MFLMAATYGGGGSDAYPVSIQVTTPPTKNTYRPGEALDLTGIVVEAIFSDNTRQVVTAQCAFSPANGTILTKDDTTITVTWVWSVLGNTYTTTQVIDMQVPYRIRVKTAPTITTYNAGDTLDLTGMVVVADYASGIEQIITSDVTCVPANGATLTESDSSVAISWTDPETGDSYSTSQAITVIRVLSSLSMSEPTKNSYKIGEALDLTGCSVIAHYSSGSTLDVTSSATFNPVNGTVFNDSGSVTLTATYTENGVTKTATCSLTVRPNLEIVTFADGTDEQLAAMLAAHYAGTINIHDHWTVGDERVVSLSAMAATGVGETHVAQSVKMVLMNAGGKTLANNQTCAFVVGQKNMLADGTTRESGYMNSSNTNTGGWKDSARRAWCNNVYYNAISSGFKALFKQFINSSGTGGGSSSGTENTTDWIALPAEIEVFGSTTYSVSGEGSQFKYYETSANRVKYAGENGGSAGSWWGRSPYSGSSSYFCRVNTDGSAGYGKASGAYGLAPFGCI